MNVKKSLSIKQVWSIALEGISQDLSGALKKAFFFCFSLAFIQFVLTYGPFILLPQPLSENLILTQRVTDAILGILLGILYSVIIPYVVFSQKGHYKNETLTGFIKRHLRLVSIETLRTLPIILIHFLLFIIPGFVKMIRLVFVPFVVQIYRPYHQGKVDALKESALLTQGSFAGLASFYYISQILIGLIVAGVPVILQKQMQYADGSITNLTVDFIFNVPIGVVVELACAVGLLKIFEQIVILKEGQDELAF